MLHFSFGGQGCREYFVAIYAGDAVVAGWAETCFAGVPAGITAVVTQHIGATWDDEPIWEHRE